MTDRPPQTKRREETRRGKSYILIIWGRARVDKKNFFEESAMLKKQAKTFLWLESEEGATQE